MNVCRIEGCEKRSHARQLCKKHYWRLTTNGDPLVTKTTPRGDLQRFYDDVILGYEGDECLIWPFYRSDDCYPHIRRNGKVIVVSRLLCEDVNGPPPTPNHDAAHSCGKGHLGCVTKKHLSWKTRTENLADQVAHGTVRRGEKNHLTKLSEGQARAILALKGMEDAPSIARRYGVTAETVTSIQNGKSWSWLSSQEDDR